MSIIPLGDENINDFAKRVNEWIDATLEKYEQEIKDNIAKQIEETFQNLVDTVIEKSKDNPDNGKLYLNFIFGEMSYQIRKHSIEIYERQVEE